MATSPPPSPGPKRGRNCYATPTLSGLPNAKRGENIRIGYPTANFYGAHKLGEMLCQPCNLRSPQTKGQNQNWRPHSCLLGGPQVGGNATQNLHPQRQMRGDDQKIATSLLPSPWPKRGWKYYVTPTFSRSPTLRQRENQNWLPHPCVLNGPQVGESTREPSILRSPTPGAGRKSEVATSPLPSQGPTRGRKYHVTLAFSGPQRQARGDNHNWLPHPCLLGGQKTGHKCCVTPTFSGVPKQGDKIRIGCLTPAFSGAQKRAELLCDHSILEVSNAKAG